MVSFSKASFLQTHLTTLQKKVVRELSDIYIAMEVNSSNPI